MEKARQLFCAGYFSSPVKEMDSLGEQVLEFLRKNDIKCGGFVLLQSLQSAQAHIAESILGGKPPSCVSLQIEVFSRSGGKPSLGKLVISERVIPQR